MRDWTAGYVADIGYTFGYYHELNPLRIKLAFLNAGLACPEVGVACELGFGQGVSVNVHATATMTKWYGTDFNPAQAAYAQDLAVRSENGAELFDQGFEEFCLRPDLPQFDYIALHGIWSWVSDANRAIIANFIRDKLKVGGVLYISYNSQPGWAATVPLRELLTLHGETMSSVGGGTAAKVAGALEFTEQLFAIDPSYVKRNPLVADRLAGLKSQNINYVAHEYFNRDWAPMSFGKVAEWLKDTKLSYACSAHYLDHIDDLNLTPAQQAFLRGIPDVVLRETSRDFITNQQFRRDYWVKGSRKISTFERAAALRSLRFVLLAPRSDISLSVRGALSEATMNERIYNPVLDLMADQCPHSFSVLERKLLEVGVTFEQLLQVLVVLMGVGYVAILSDAADQEVVSGRTSKLNSHLITQALGSGDIGVLASPITGGAVAVGRMEQLFLLAIAQGKRESDALVDFVWSIVKPQGQKILKDGKPLDTDEENLVELSNQVAIFLKYRLPILKSLGVL